LVLQPSADAAHFLLEPAECLPVPVQVNPEPMKEGSVLGAQLPAE
jgi:hypothetical protein